MSPYCIIKVREQEYKTSVLKNDGNMPDWRETFDISVYSMDDDLTIRVFDEDEFQDNEVGDANIKLSSICANGGSNEWYKIFYKG